jgi:hypothetical protein
MNKKHWNTVMLNGSVPDKEVFSWIDNSYELIAGKLKIKDEEEQMNNRTIELRNQNQLILSLLLHSEFSCSNVLTSKNIMQIID